MLLPPTCDLALKEWAVAVDALATGKQIVALRKGGIHKEDKDFRIVHPEFLLYPTYEHQKAELLKDAYHADLERTLSENDVPGLVTLGYWCQVTEKYQVSDQDVVESLAPYHIWTSDFAQTRLHWRPKQPLTVALLRVYSLLQPQALPILDEYSGCKSWVELGQDVPLGNLTPVVSDDDFESLSGEIKDVLGSTPAAV